MNRNTQSVSAELQALWKAVDSEEARLDKEHYAEIYLGDPAMFYSFLMQEAKFLEECLCHIDDMICKGGVIHHWITLSLLHQTMKRSIQEFIDRSEWSKKKVRFSPH